MENASWYKLVTIKFHKYSLSAGVSRAWKPSMFCCVWEGHQVLLHFFKHRANFIQRLDLQSGMSLLLFWQRPRTIIRKTWLWVPANYSWTIINYCDLFSLVPWSSVMKTRLNNWNAFLTLELYLRTLNAILRNKLITEGSTLHIHVDVEDVVGVVAAFEFYWCFLPSVNPVTGGHHRMLNKSSTNT